MSEFMLKRSPGLRNPSLHWLLPNWNPSCAAGIQAGPGGLFPPALYLLCLFCWLLLPRDKGLVLCNPLAFRK